MNKINLTIDQREKMYHAFNGVIESRCKNNPKAYKILRDSMDRFFEQIDQNTILIPTNKDQRNQNENENYNAEIQTEILSNQFHETLTRLTTLQKDMPHFIKESERKLNIINQQL
ncbi:hypothetical protein M0813_09180 [Anaeramoeba flamelloides]|uniref:Uncharacterized protein n=1 Tax=Anaeramoeba flamelloides TaxID=1746091 RepID=A0AAV8AAM7_9EUKA|nr:hypothetical protein M0812_04867 [Anaeramoeba flamelloides]KAJ6228042.1 hypothetical protein M0813_09180 [Anaeramoeba flamelloides]